MAQYDLALCQMDGSGIWQPLAIGRIAHVADPTAAAALTQQAMTDSTGGSPGTTIPAFSASPTQAECNNALASVLARLAEIKVDVAAMKTAIDNNNAAIDSILATLETFKMHATA